MGRAMRIGVAAVALSALGGCVTDAFTYTVGRYGTAASTNVTLRCRDTYEVVDRPDAGSLLVITNALNEALVACLDGGPPLAERQRQVAQLHLTEKTNRPQCRILGSTELTLFHREFSYSCVAPIGPAPSGARGRG